MCKNRKKKNEERKQKKRGKNGEGREEEREKTGEGRAPVVGEESGGGKRDRKRERAPRGERESGEGSAEQRRPPELGGWSVRERNFWCEGERKIEREICEGERETERRRRRGRERDWGDQRRRGCRWGEKQLG